MMYGLFHVFPSLPGAGWFGEYWLQLRITHLSTWWGADYRKFFTADLVGTIESI
jgi:hypothetical protein